MSVSIERSERDGVWCSPYGPERTTWKEIRGDIWVSLDVSHVPAQERDVPDLVIGMHSQIESEELAQGMVTDQST